MSATELLEHLKQLPQEEQAAFAHRFHEWEAQSTMPNPGRNIQWPAPRVRHQRIFGDLAITNMVLLAREEDRF